MVKLIATSGEFTDLLNVGTCSNNVDQTPMFISHIPREPKKQIQCPARGSAYLASSREPTPGPSSMPSLKKK